MICNKLTIDNYRNISSAEIEFCDGVNILVGDNAEGKTNALEAIYLFALGKSFRAAKERDLISFGNDRASVGLAYSARGREQSLEIKYSAFGRRQIYHNKVKLAKISELVGEFKAVLFCPEHLSLIKDGPCERRNFLDVAISQIRPVYMRSLQRYNIILANRNKLIKEAEENRAHFNAMIEVLSYQLACEAANIASARVEYVSKLKKYVSECFSDMTGEREVPELRYHGSAKEEEAAYFDTEYIKNKYFELLMSKTEREIAALSTLYGTHKDDIDIDLNGRSARLFASQGQQRSLALSLKLSEGQISAEEDGEEPVFLLDDVLSELDLGRREYICRNLSGRQVIMTTCEKDFRYPGEPRMIKVKNGTYEAKENTKETF